MAFIVELENTEAVISEVLQSQVTSDLPDWFIRNYGRNVIVSSDGQVLAVGSDDYKDDVPYGASPIQDNYGRVIVWAKSGDTWVLREKVTITGVAYDFFSFGWGERSVALSSDGSKLVIGADGFKDGSNGNSPIGRIYTFTWNGSNYVEGNPLPFPGSPDIGVISYKWGDWLAMSGDGLKLVVGVPDWGLNTPDVYGYLKYYEWNGGTSSWDFVENLTPVDASSEQWGQYPSMSDDGTLLLFSNKSSPNDPIFLEDTGSGFARITPSIVWASNATQTRVTRVALRADGLAFWGYYNTTDGWREFTKNGSAWVQSETKLDVTNFNDKSPELWPDPDGDTVYATDISISPIGNSSFKGNVYTISNVQQTISTCYEKVAEYGIIDYLCVEAPPPPTISEGTGPSLPRPPTVTATPTEPASEYPYKTSCDDLLASWMAARALSDNPDYQGFIDDSIASSQIFNDANGDELCR